MNRVEAHAGICKTLNEIYKKKNHDYGNSFKKVRDEVPEAILARPLDKTNRLVQLMKNGNQQVVDESVTDTLLDLANYAIMEVIEMEIDSTDKPTNISTKPKFRLNDFKGECVMHCDAKEKAKIFCNYLDLKRKTWCSKTSYKAFNPWYLFEENTCYDFNTGEFGDKDFYEKEGYTILEFDDFDWSKEETNDRTHTR